MTGPRDFLERWSRLKRSRPAAPDAPRASPAERAAVPLPAGDGEVALPPRAPAAYEAPAAAEAPLPPIESLTPDADFTGFLKREVGESLRRAAMRKLFSDPHFNRMDGLDVYIDDYSAADPIPPEMLQRLRQFRTLVAGEATEPGATAVEPPSPGPSTPDPRPDEPGGKPERDAPEPEEPEREDPEPGEPGRRDPGHGEPGRDEPGVDEPARDEPGRDRPVPEPELPERDAMDRATGFRSG